MTWSDAARNHLEAHLANLRQHLNPAVVDVDEVVADCRRHVEADLAGRAAVEVADIVTSLARLGPVAETTTVPPAGLEQRLQGKRRRFWPVPRPRGLWWCVQVVILPAIAWGLAMAHLDLFNAWNPLPTVLHQILVACVPIAGVWMALRPQEASWPHLALRGLALGTAAFYTAAFGPLLVFGCIAILALGLGVLILSPLLALIPLVVQVVKDRVRPRQRRITVAWALAAALALIAVEVRGVVTQYLVEQAHNPTQRAATAQFLRRYGDLDRLASLAMNDSRASVRVSAPWFDVLSLRNERSDLQARASELYFRATGRMVAFHPDLTASRLAAWRSDAFLGTQEVGTTVVGLSLRESRLDGSCDAAGGIAYLEWMMVFTNQGPAAAEARCLLALPPGGVVSRLTLWVAGEPREAAVGSRNQAVGAYRQVAVQQERDPALVTTAGGDRVLLQCFPVPANGSLQVRLGITAPMVLANDRASAALLTPACLTHNLQSAPDRHPLWIAAKGGIGPVNGTATADWRSEVPWTTSIRLVAPRDPMVRRVVHGPVQQTWETSIPMKPIVLIDASAALAPWRDLLTKGLPQRVQAARTMLVQEDVVSDDAVWEGGHDNSRAVARILTEAGTMPVVWLHGPQPVGNGSSDLRAALERGAGRLIAVAVASGPQVVLQGLDHPGLQTLTVAADDLITALTDLLAAPVPHRGPAVAEGDAHHQTSDHLLRLEAFDRIRAALARGNTGREEGLALAIQHRLATPLSGLVVLETRAQEVAQGLDPAGPSQVPAVPEPEIWLLLCAVAMLLAWWWYRRRLWWA